MFLRTLGDLTLEGSSFTRPKPLLLLAYLALEGPQDRRHLAELFWPKAANHMKSLAVALTQLCQGAAGAIDADDKRVKSPVSSDARQLLTFVEEGRLEEALVFIRDAGRRPPPRG